MRRSLKRTELACRGTLTATVPGQSLYKAPQTYLAQHPTAPPEEQVITTDPENVLLRVLKLSQKKESSKGKGDKGKAAEKSKRYALFHGFIDSHCKLLLAYPSTMRWLCRPAAEAAEGAPVNKKQNLQAATGGQLILIYLVTMFMCPTPCLLLMVCYCSDGEAGSSRGSKAEKFTLQELQGRTNKALMVRPVA